MCVCVLIIMTDVCVKWSCEYCTYENWPSAIKCTMCRAQRPMGSIITEEVFSGDTGPPSGHQWDPACQDSHLLICPDSSARPRVPPVQSSERSGKWSCEGCTYQNWPQAIRCTQCQSLRPHRPTDGPQTSGIVRRAATASHTDPCEEYNDRNRANTGAQCWTCTYEDWSKSPHCVVCDHPRPNNAIQPSEPDESVINERVSGRRCEAELQMTLTAGAQSGKEEIEMDSKKVKQMKNRMRRTDWLFLNACTGERLSVCCTCFVCRESPAHIHVCAQV